MDLISQEKKKWIFAEERKKLKVYKNNFISKKKKIEKLKPKKTQKTKQLYFPFLCPLKR
jgi:hypothetical protein